MRKQDQRNNPTSAATAVRDSVSIPTKEEFLALVNRAQSGDETATAPLRQMLNSAANQERFVSLLGGDLGRESIEILVYKYAGKDLLKREALSKKLDLMRSDLLGLRPSAIEKLLVERVIATWLHLHHLEFVYASKDSHLVEIAAFYQKAITSTQKRYLAAINGLANVRKRAVPTVQVNIAKKQVNLASGAVAAGSVGS